MCTESASVIEHLKDVIRCWEEAINWIAGGWDCLEEYTHDVSYREDIDDALANLNLNDSEIQPLLKKLSKADNRFREVTEASRLCVWHVTPQYRYYPQYDQVELRFKPYDPDTYWYYHCWPPDSPFPFREHDGISFQRDECGLDFEKMSEEELKEAARRMSISNLKKLKDEFGVVPSGAAAVNQQPDQ